MQASKAKWIISESGAIDVSSKHNEQAWNMGELNGLGDRTGILDK